MKSVAIIGLGTMGSAIRERLTAKFDLILVGTNNDEIAKVAKVDFIIIAVKPQQFGELSKQLQPFIKNQTIISIMAGVKIASISTVLKSDKIVRTMPNLAIQTGRSVTGAFSKNNALLAEVEPILATWGSVSWLDDEELFDAFTALAGSGPAYFFKLAEAIKLAAIRYGFSEEEADNIAVKTFQGAASVIDKDPSSWVNKVASKGGTTQASLGVLSELGFDKIMEDAIEAAKNRSEELSKND